MQEYKLLNKNLDFIPTPKVYNKKELDNDLKNFFRLIKLKAHFKDSINKDISNENKIFKANKTKDEHQTKIIIPLTHMLQL